MISQDNRIKKIASCFNWLNLMSISIFVGIISSYAPKMIVDSYNKELPCLLFFFVSLGFGIFSLKNRSVVEEYMKGELLFQNLQRGPDLTSSTIIRQSQSESMRVAVKNNYDESKKTVIFFLLMIAAFAIMLFIQSLYNNEKSLIDLQEKKQINTLIKDTKNIIDQISVNYTKTGALVDKNQLQQNSIIAKIQVLLSNMSKIELTLERIEERQGACK